MPDILIRGMEMPHSCLECTLCAFDGCDSDYCPFTGIEALSIGRQDNCPLVELPTHGDLIDVSKVVIEYGGLAKIAPHDFLGIAKYFADQIERQPVAVPAERSGE